MIAFKNKKSDNKEVRDGNAPSSRGGALLNKRMVWTALIWNTAK
jgi:hypothetical protein